MATAPKKVGVPRGIRNNNPLNIRVGNQWKGEIRDAKEKDFEVFESMVYGLRAAFMLLLRYIVVYKRDTIAKIVRYWAPPSENNTERYIKFLEEAMGRKRNVPIKFTDRETMCSLLYWMAKMETGTGVDMEDVAEGYDMAYKDSPYCKPRS